MGSIIMLLLLHLAFLTSVSAHGGVLWPPTWQAGVATPIEELNSEEVFSNPLVHDPKTGKAVKDIKSWLTDQAYTGGVGDEFKESNPWTSPQSWWRLWRFRRKPVGLPKGQGQETSWISMWSKEGGRWSRRERNVIFRHRCSPL